MTYAQLGLFAISISVAFGFLAGLLTYLDSSQTGKELATAREETARAQEGAALANERAGHLAHETESLRAQAAGDQLKAAGLEREAALLRLQLQHTRSMVAGRDLTDAQMQRLKADLAGHSYRILVCYGPDPEARLYAARWKEALGRAGQTLIESVVPCGGTTFNGAGQGSPTLFVRGKDAGTITQTPLWKALVNMGFRLGYSADSPVPNLDVEIDASIELPSRAPPLLHQFDR